jgi:phosphohistidine swiveling domain-containing protein
MFGAQEARDRKLLAAELPRRFERDLRAASDDDLLRGFRELIEGAYRTVEENYFRTIFCASLAKLDFRSALGDLPLSCTMLVGGLDNLEHFECAHSLWQLANWPRTGSAEAGNADGAELECFLAEYGHHSRRELDLRVPRWREDVPWVVGLCRQLVGTEDPAEANRRQRRQFAAELDRARRLLPRWRRRGFETKLFRLRRNLWLREQMRDLSARMYALIRRFVLELGRRATLAGWLRSDDEIFYLTFEEICRLPDLHADDRVEARRQYERMYRDFRAPNEVGRGFPSRAVDQRGRRLTGIGCSAGTATGRVRVVTSLDEAGKLGPGDILVCPFTDPGWTPLLNVAAGVVTENGGLLSHAAVICRECAIPAVLNVAGATRLLRDGQRVRINGDNGHVDIL